MSASSGHSIMPLAWRACLEQAGFVPSAAGFRYGDITCRGFPRWLTFRAAKRVADGLGSPGLWSHVEDGYRFALPVAAILPSEGARDEELDEGQDLTFSAYLKWVLASADGKLPRAWRAPEAELVRSWLPPQSLTLRRGPYLRQGELILAPTRWALRFSVLPRLAQTLPPAREKFLQELVHDAGRRWRMVRLGFQETDTGRSLVAETDLSGAPPSDKLFLTSLESLQYALQSLLETAELLANVDVTLRALELGCTTNNPQKG